ncbi:MAG TPA: site-specific integrase [Thermoleophilaceae bacterium]|nr:site-specific integrase [Thermoleophilaceae bacterium]
MAEAREAKGRKAAGERTPTSRIGFEEYYDGWITSYAGRTARGFSDTTRTEYRRSLADHAVPRWRTWKLAEVEPSDVRELFADMAATGTTSAGIRKLRAALSVLFASAVEEDKLRTNPVAGVRIPQTSEPDDDGEDVRKALTETELALLLSELPDEWRTFFRLLAQTGMRISEAVGLTWAHVDLGERPKVKVREQVYRGKRRRLKSKNSQRDIPLSPDMAKALMARRRDSFAGANSPVFASGSGAPLNPSNVRGRVLLPATEAVGLGEYVDVEKGDKVVREWRTWVNFHVFRHTCASMLFAEGRNVKQVSRWLGHAKASFTLEVYVHLMDDGVGDASFFDGIVGPSVAGATP